MSGETYTKRYPAGFVDLPSETTAIDSQFLNAVEQALVRLLGADPGNSTVPAWSAALSRFVFQLLTNASVDPAAAIARSKLDFGAGLVDADLAAGANIAQSKIAGSVLSPTIVDAKGDLIAGQVDNVAARLAVGADNTLLVADSSQALGLRYMTQAQLAALQSPLSLTALVTSLPGSPNDGQEVILVDSTSAPTIGVHKRYVAAASKWINLGCFPWRKETSKTVNNTVTETDLLNGEFTLKGNALGVNGTLRLVMAGDWLQNSGSNTGPPRFKFKVGAGPTTIIDTNTGTASASSVNRKAWEIVVEIRNLGATGSQWTSIEGSVMYDGANAAGVVFTTGEGIYSIGVQGMCLIIGGNAMSLDTTADQSIQFAVINPIAHA